MPNIATQDARGLFTSMLVDVYTERPIATKFLMSFFKTKVKKSKSLSIEVQRGTEKIAVDVERATRGNKNNFTRSSEKLFVPPYYNEWFNITEIDLYDRLFGSELTIDASVFADFLQSISDKIRALMDKISRASELQCAQALETGIVLLKSGDNIDYKRKAGSMVDLGAGQYFAAGGSNPYASFKAGGDWLRQNGKIQGTVLNAVFGDTAISDFLSNAAVLARGPLTNVNLDSISAPQRNAEGGVLHGEISAGSYRIRLWSYPEYYEDASGTLVPYVNPKKVFLMPENPNFVLGYAQVPRLLDDPQAKDVDSGQYVVTDWITEDRTAHNYSVKSAPLAIITGVDQIYTMKAVS